MIFNNKFLFINFFFLIDWTGFGSAASTALATVWMGCQCGKLYIHSAVLHWKKPLKVVKMPDAVLAIM